MNIKEAIDTINNLISNRDLKTNFNSIKELGDLTVKEIIEIKKATNFDLTGYKRVIDKSSIRHVIKEHGDPKVELRKGQIAITIEDFLLIPYIVTEYDTIIKGSKTNLGRETIKYKKKIGNLYVFVEEIRTGRKSLCLVSMYKKPLKR